MKPKCKVLIATGGTGGHLFPAQQLCQELQECEVLFAGHKLATSPFLNREQISFREIASSPMNRLSFLKNAAKGLWQSLKLLRAFKPDVVVGFGSFHCFPVLLAAALLRKKIVLFEANCSLGLVNRFFAPFAEKIAFQFPVAMKKSALVPLLPWGSAAAKVWNKEEARKAMGLSPDLLTILVFGGSQGAVFINQTFCEAAALLKQKGVLFQVIHLTGNQEKGESAFYEKAGIRAVVKPFETEMAMAYAAAEIAVCRCGAGTTAELIRFQLPALLIPYPFAHDHQRKNGEFLGTGARILLQNEAGVEKLASAIEQLIDERFQCKKALEEMKFEDAVSLAHLVRTVGGT